MSPVGTDRIDEKSEPAQLSGSELALAAAPLTAACLALLALGDLGGRPRAAVALLAFAFAAWAWSVRRIGARELRMGQLLMVAVALRCLLLPLAPTLSEDSLRYVWDGRVLVAGHNPYLLPPGAPELSALRDDAWRAMPHHDVPTVYPPLAMTLFAAAALLPWPWLALKVLLCAVDLLGCALLWRLARRLGLPTARTALYAWNPLILLEVAGMAHIDALMATASIAAVLLLVEGRAGRAGLAAAAAVLAKIVPIVALPLWWLRAPGRGRFAAAAALALLAGALPILLTVGGLPPGLWIYGITWEFNGPLFEPLWRIYDGVDAVAAIKSVLDAVRGATGSEGWLRLYPYVYPQLLAKLTLGLVLAVALFRLWRRRPHPAIAAEGAFGAFLLCSATVYPWYLLLVLPWAALGRRLSWLVLSATVVLSYLPQKVAGWELFPVFWLAVWLPFFGIWLREEAWTID